MPNKSISTKLNVLSSSMLNLVSITGDECYKKGILALQNGNDKKAFDLFSQGYGKFHGPCLKELGKMYRNGNFVEVDKDRAMFFFKRGAYNYKDQECNFLVGELYCYEKENELNQEGLKILNSIKSMNTSIESIQQWLIGEMYRLGLGHQKSFNRAIDWYNGALNAYKSSNIVLHDSFCNNIYISLGQIYEKGGHGEEKNYLLALDYYEKAANHNCIEAYNRIGNFYRDGLGVSIDNTKAFNSYFKAATGIQDDEEPCTSGQFNLGLMYRNGLGTKVDNDSAMYWFKKATYGGNKEAGDYLEQMLYQINITETRKKNTVEREKQLRPFQQSLENKEIQSNNTQKTIRESEKIDLLMTQYFERWESIGAEPKNQIECNK